MAKNSQEFLTDLEFSVLAMPEDQEFRTWGSNTVHCTIENTAEQPHDGLKPSIDLWPRMRFCFW